ncbi:hypothetical protein ABK040_004041 [Willaertia magna]
MQQERSKVVYEVNLIIDKEIEEEFKSWLPEHIQLILKIKGFIEARWFESDPVENNLDNNKTYYTVHYLLEDRESLQNYFDNHASELRKDGINRFGTKFSASRRVMILKNVFQSHSKKCSIKL